MAKLLRTFLGLGLACALSTGACDTGKTNDPNIPDPNNPPPVVEMPAIGDGTVNGMGFDHDGVLNPTAGQTDVFPDGTPLKPEQSEKLHACGKLQYSALRSILTARGVNLATMTANSAGVLYATGANVLGTANYAQRVPESDRNTAGGLVRLYDIVIAAAEEILPAPTDMTKPHDIPDRQSTAAGSPCPGVRLFNPTDGTCNPDGIACFIGMPPTQGQLSLCNSMALSPDITFDAANSVVRKRMALAALASPVFLCD